MAGVPRVEFFFDIASPYSYLAATQIETVVTQAGGVVVWRPMLLGGVFRAVGNQPPAMLPPRARYMLRDLHRWAEHYQVQFRFPALFPLNSLLTMRALTAVAEAERVQAAMAAFHAYWVEGLDVSSPEVLAMALGEEAVARAGEEDVKDRLRATTEEAVARGAFGAPSIFVGDELFFGNDRLGFVAAAVQAMV